MRRVASDVAPVAEFTVKLNKIGKDKGPISSIGNVILQMRHQFSISPLPHIIDPTHETTGRTVVWSHPAFAHKCMYVRNDKEIVRVSLAR